MADERAHRGHFLGKSFAAPLVHEEFLELERDRAAPRGISVVDETRLFSFALEGDVFAHIEPAPVEIEAAHGLHQWID